MKTSGSLLTFILFLTLTTSTLIIYGDPEAGESQHLSLIIDMDGMPIEYANNESAAILMNTTTGVIARVQCISLGEEPIRLNEINTVFIIADYDLISKPEKIDVILNPGDNVTFIQTWQFDNNLLDQNISLISGVYKVKYEIKYSIQNINETISGPPFFIDFNVNPMKSVFGVLATASLAFTTLSAIRLVSNFGGSASTEIKNSIKDAKFSPSAELRSFYKETGFSKMQSEFGQRTIGYASNKWKKDKCPECRTDWEPDSDFCQVCGTTKEQAEEKHANSLLQKALNAGEEIVDSVDGLTLGDIAIQLSDNVTPTGDIIELLTFSGLAIVQPRISKNWNQKSRNLVFTGLQWGLYAVFWIQACGISTISLFYLGLAIFSGILLPIIIGKIYTDKIKDGVKEYWSNFGKR